MEIIWKTSKWRIKNYSRNSVAGATSTHAKHLQSIFTFLEDIFQLASNETILMPFFFRRSAKVLGILR